MPKPASFALIQARLILFMAFFSAACSDQPAQVPFPGNIPSGVSPSVFPIAFSKPEPIHWQMAPADSIHAAPIKKFDLQQIPPTTIDMELFNPLRSPMTEVRLDWGGLTNLPFAWKMLPDKKASFKTYLLQQPRRIKAGIPHSREGATLGLLSFDEDDGLPGLRVSVIMRDRYRNMWIGTESGLCRYDGEFIDIFNISTEGKTSLGILKLAEDQRGRIWIGTAGEGVVMLDQKNGTLTKLQSGTDLDNNEIFGLMCDKKGRIWTGSWSGGVDVIDPGMQTLRHIGTAEGMTDDRVNGFMEDSRGRIWISTYTGANVIDFDSSKIFNIKEENGLSSNQTENFMQDRQGRIWIATRYGVDILDLKSGKIKFVGELQGMTSANTRALYEDRLGNVWIGTFDGGIDVLNEQGTSIKHLGLAQGLNKNACFDFEEGPHGRIWIASFGGGVNIARYGGDNLRHLKIRSEQNKPPIKSLLQDSLGRIWTMCSEDGVYVLDPSNGSVRRISNLQGLGNSSYSSLAEGSHGDIWAAGLEGLDEINQQKGIIRHLGPAQGLGSEVILALLSDRQKNILTGGFGGLQKIDAVRGEASSLYIGNKRLADTVIALFQDIAGEIWVVGTTTTYRMDPENKTISYILKQPPFGDNLLPSVLQDSEKRIWIGTTNGLFMINSGESEIMHFTQKEGLPDNGIWSMLIVKDKLYAGTNKGLSILNISPQNNEGKVNWTISNYGKSFGLTDVSFRPGTALVTRSGDLYWGIRDQLTIMRPETNDSASETTFVNGMEVSDHMQFFSERPWRSASWKISDTIWNEGGKGFFTKEKIPADTGFQYANHIRFDSIAEPFNMPVNLNLPYYENYISFHFTSSNREDRENTRYRYILEGIDKNWSAVIERPYSEHYRDLPTGQYIFRVASSGPGGIWSSPGSFTFTINPPWWKTWWAYLSYLILIAGALWAFIRYRSRMLIMEKHALEHKVNLRTAEVVKQKEEIAVQRDNLEHTLVELKNAQSQLIQSEKMASLGELTAGVAHEIQNPLNFVNNFSEVNLELLDEMTHEMESGNTDAALQAANDIRNNLEKVVHHGKRADAIVKGMLQHSRSSTGQMERTDINALSDEYLRLSYHGLRAKDKAFNAVMKTNFDPQAGMANIIPQDISRVLLNLYNNAFYSVSEKKKTAAPDYTPTVSVSTKKQGNKLEIKVRDNGIGISSKVVDKIFQPFFTTKPTGEGTGLGLSLSYDIVTKQHEGLLKVDTREGEYSEFTIILPKAFSS
jgi:signal transduction histidine kinase/ligand-binding sensor domain-containing protein